MTTLPLPPTGRRWTWHLLALALLIVGLCVCYTREPGFGDDLTYWTFGFELHEKGLSVWREKSFHDLRWPVWGVCYLLQSVFGYNMISYVGAAAFYAGVGGGVCFTLGKKLTGSLAAAWACGLVFVFHPLLDSLLFRPMPDLSEGVWGGLTMLAWWQLMHSTARGKSIAWAALTGLLVYLTETNRITGAFIAPVLAVCTLCFFPRKFWWLVASGAFAALSYFAEMCFYRWRFHDWLHNLHAHDYAKGVKGTEPIPVWRLPIRYVPFFWKGYALKPILSVFTLLGMWVCWFRRIPRTGAAVELPADDRAVLGRVLVVWLATLFFLYSCAPQSFSPYRPLVREGDRFLASLVVPIAALVGVGLFWLWHWAAARSWRAARWTAAHPALTGAVALALLASATAGERRFFNLGFLTKMSPYMANLPAGTKVYTHDTMRSLAFLANEKAARTFTWLAPRVVLYNTPATEKLLAQADEMWFARKLMWATNRKQLERGEAAQPLASVFTEPTQTWKVRMVLMSGDNPDLIFQQRRAAGDPPPRVLDGSSPELASMQPPPVPLPHEWVGAKSDAAGVVNAHWDVPPTMRGQVVRLEIQASSKSMEAFTGRLLFHQGKKLLLDCQIKPYLLPQIPKDFFSFQIPPGAETCEIRLRFEKKVESVKFEGFRVILEGPPAFSEFP